jgi:hypothetical protein
VVIRYSTCPDQQRCVNDHHDERATAGPGQWPATDTSRRRDENTNLAGAARGFVACLHRPRWELASLSRALRAQCASTWTRLQPGSNDGTDECLRTVTAPGTPVTAPQMLRRYGASARSARARRSYDRIIAGVP